MHLLICMLACMTNSLIYNMSGRALIYLVGGGIVGEGATPGPPKQKLWRDEA